MRIDESRSETATVHIGRMAKLFSDGELRLMRSGATEKEKCVAVPSTGKKHPVFFLLKKFLEECKPSTYQSLLTLPRSLKCCCPELELEELSCPFFRL